MSKTFERMSGIMEVDVESFRRLPLKDRLRGATGIFLFNIAVGSFIALTFFFDLERTTSIFNQIIWFYSLIVLISLFQILPLLVHPLIRFRNAFMIARLLLSFVLVILLARMLDHFHADIHFLYTKLLVYLAGVFSLAVSTRIYLKLIKQSAEEKSDMEHKIHIAHQVQANLVPDIHIQSNHFHFFGKTQSFEEVGGDLFDLYPLPDGRIAVTMGDVSGHDIAAGLLMAITRGAFRTEMNYLSTLPALMASMNRTIRANSNHCMFVTFLCALFDFRHSIATFVNAGHPPVLLRNHENGTVTEFPKNGAALGLADDIRYESRTIPFKENDIFLFFTDGLVESLNAEENEYGIARLRHILESATPDIPSDKLFDLILQDHGAYKNNDDITLAVMKIKNIFKPTH